MIMKKLIIIVVTLCTSVSAHAYYTPKQIHNIKDAMRIWESVSGHPETGAATILQESSAGEDDLIGDDGMSLGLGHVTEAAAIDVVDACRAGRYKKHCNLIKVYIQDKEGLKLRLALDDRFNIVVSALYFKIQYDWFMDNGYDLPWSRAVIAYAAGRGNAMRLSRAQVYGHTRLQRIRGRINNLRVNL